MRLFIAEKPDLAKAIMQGLGGGERRSGYFDCGDDYVTWAFGHMLQLLDPEDYDPQYGKWSMDHLPISHIPWKKKPGADKEEQLNIILQLIGDADSVVNAGDPDDEGQLLVDEILEYAGCAVPVKRVLINDNNTKIVKKALANLRDNSEFAGLSAAAEARSVGDQLYGYNLTRCYTLAAQQKGHDGVLSVGRVQTPVLGMVVRRDRLHGAHKKAYYYTVTGQFAFGEVGFPARYQVVGDDPVDDKGRLSDADHAKAIAVAVSKKSASVVSAKTKAKSQNPPLPYNLLKLQTDASRKYGLKPDKVKEITQTLRERHKLITYNRSDCEYLSDEQHADAPAVLAAIGQTAPMLAIPSTKADPAIKSRAFNSKKVSAHHAIIPTEGTADLAALSDEEQKIYLLIARAYIAQFWPKHEFDQTDLILECEGYRFTVRSNVTTTTGWKALYKNDAGNEDLEGNDDDVALDIRSLNVAQKGECLNAKAEKIATKPLPLYTMSTLLMDLTRVAKYIKSDRLRKLLVEKDKDKQGEHGGIGTPATRDSIIATLFERGYLQEKGKSIVSTATAREFYDALPDQAKYPDMTALWHEQQKAIQAGELNPVTFVRGLLDYVGKEVARVKEYGIGITVTGYQCPECSRVLRRIKGKKGYFWGCTGFVDGCKYSCPDVKGKPVAKPSASVSTLHKCMSCGKGLTRRAGKAKGTYWWGCSGYPDCKQTYPDLKGKPNYNKASS